MFGFGRRQLVDVPEDVTAVPVGSLSVHTAEQLVIITIDASSAPLLVDAAVSRRPHSLTAGGTTVFVVPVRDARLVPAHDPKLGWIIPLTSAAADDLAARVTAGPGGYEIAGINLAVVVE